MKRIQKRLWFFLSAAIVCLGMISCGEELADEDYVLKHETEDVIDDDGVPSGTPGSQNMYGIYSCVGTNGDVWKSFKETAEYNISFHQGESSYWDNYFENYAIWIVDDKTIYWVDDYIYFINYRPTSDGESILLESEYYTFKYQKWVVAHWYEYTANYYLAHYVSKFRTNDKYKWEGRYAMNGSQIIVNTDETTKWVDGRQYAAAGNTWVWDYSDGVITTEDGVKYVKVN